MGRGPSGQRAGRSSPSILVSNHVRSAAAGSDGERSQSPNQAQGERKRTTLHAALAHLPPQSSALKLGTLSRSSTYSTAADADLDDMNQLPSSSGPQGVGSVPNLPSASLSSALESLRTTVQKRITTFKYLREAHGGQMYWFNVGGEACEPGGTDADGCCCADGVAGPG